MFCWNINWMGGIMKPLPKVRMNGKEYNLLPGHDLRKL